MTPRLAVLALAISAVLTSPAAVAQSSGERLRFTAFAVNLSNIATGATLLLEIDVNSWSTEAERTRLIETATARENNQDALLKVLRDMPKRGRMRAPQWQGPDPLNARLGWDIRYASQRPTDEGGRRVVLATDRYVGFWEARNQPRTIDYPFTLIEIDVDRNGRGQGKMSVATRIRFDEKRQVVELENYTSEPVRLNDVKMTAR